MGDVRAVEVRGRAIGPGHPCYVIAEIGINHNGDLGLATRMIVAAAKAGADAVKLQNYRTEDFLSDRSLTYRYRSGGRVIEEPQYEMFKRCELGPGAVERLKAEADRAGIDFLSTPTHPEGVDLLVRVGAAAIKNGSDFLGNLPLIRHMAASGLPTILSTGMADGDEIGEAVEAFREAGGRKLILLHCVSIYPAPADQLNLRRIRTLQDVFACPVGFSDHSEGVVGAVVAATLGAAVVEKHFTLDRSLPGPDQRLSSDPAELAQLVDSLRRAGAALGVGGLSPAAGEAEGRLGYRLSCVAAVDLEQGHRLGAGDIAFARPGDGLRPKLAATLVGRTLTRDVAKGHVFRPSDVA